MKKTYSFCDEKEIKELLMFRKIVEVQGDSMILDNGVKLNVLPNIGCCCGAGNYYVENIASVPNAITDVIFSEDYYEKDGEYMTAYKIYVICEGIQGEQELLKVSGTDGNGYYGTGYEIEVVIE